MCGIAGFVAFTGHAPEQARTRVRRMTDTLFHRGPDEEGAYVDEWAALGHRRLAIIDLKSGQQPMGVSDGQVQIVFNGEIYNFAELRDELERKGHRFETRSDTEVILRGYLEWGEECAARFNGMFAFAIWDRRFKRLLLARDRVGKKPLYYFRQGTVVGFASELKGLRAGGVCRDEVDLESLDCYLSLGYIPAPRTIYRDVRKLEPSRVKVFTENGESERQYWRLQFGEPEKLSLPDAVTELEALLDDAVKCRLVSEVPLGAFLSGGLDSSLVVASMSKALDGRVTTNTIGFGDPRFNELSTARSIATHLKTDHHELVVEPQAAEVLEKIAFHFDEPVADSSALPTWYVCQMARRTVTVALSGDGGDEAFGGYTARYVPHVHESLIRGLLPPAARALLFAPLARAWPASARLPRPLRLKTIWGNLAVGDAEAYYRDLAWMDGDTRRRLYAPDFTKTLNGFTPFEIVNSHYSRNDAVDALGRSQFADVSVYMTDDVLVKVDRMSMAHSLEVRSPLLDYRILEFAAKMRSDFKLKRGRGKVLLRALAARRLPASILNLPKRGFEIPAASWLRGELRPQLEASLFAPNGIVRSLLRREELERLSNEHMSGHRDHSVLLWGLMMLSLWERAQVAPASTRS